MPSTYNDANLAPVPAGSGEGSGAAPGRMRHGLMLALVATTLAAAGFLAYSRWADEQAVQERSGPDASRASPTKPNFVALEPLTVNLADSGGERYAQVGLTLEVADAKAAERIRTHMPAVRNNILLVMADKTATQLMGREGKAQLAQEVQREAAKAMGQGAPKVSAVHFSTFIIQ